MENINKYLIKCYQIEADNTDGMFLWIENVCGDEVKCYWQMDDEDLTEGHTIILKEEINKIYDRQHKLVWDKKVKQDDNKIGIKDLLEAAHNNGVMIIDRRSK